jgi:hypothetical protein
MNTHSRVQRRLPGYLRFLVTSLVLSFAGVATALGQQLPAEDQQLSAEQTTEQGHTEMDQINLANPEGELVAPEAAKETSPFFRDTKWSAQLRSFYFDRDKYDGSESEAWALGGSISYLSGYLGNFFRIGATGYTSQPLYAPDDKDGTLLLKPGQEGYAVLGQLYGEFKFSDKIFAAIGAKTYNTPYINANDVRMTPNTFEGATLYGTLGGDQGEPSFRFGGGYIDKIKQKNDDGFVSMSEAAGVKSVDRGVAVAGGNYIAGDFSIGAAEYYSDDILNIFYAESKYAFKFGEGAKLSLAAQYSDQQSTGDNLLTGRSFNTNQWGIKGDLTFGGAGLLTVAYTDTASGENMRAPWSGYPGYTSVQVKDFNRASESAVLVKGLYDFSKHGASGFSAYVLYVHGSGVKAPNYNEDETDVNLQWNVKTGALRGLSFRLRYAYIEQRGGGDPNINDLRFIVNYDFPRPGG